MSVENALALARLLSGNGTTDDDPAEEENVPAIQAEHAEAPADE